MKAFIYTLVSLMLFITAPARALDISEGQGQAIKLVSGFNPNDYPCAKKGLEVLYSNRAKVSQMGSFNPQRIFQQMADFIQYYAIQWTNWIKSTFNKNSVRDGIIEARSLALSGNALGNVESRVDSWLSGLSQRGQFVVEHKASDIIRNTTNIDGSCK